MTRFALLLGDAPEDFRQKKIDEMNDFLSSDADGNFQVVTFANGISEFMMEAVLENAFTQSPSNILLYICTRSSVKDDKKSFWLSDETIRRDVILHYQKLAEKNGIEMQVIFDVCNDFVSEEELGYEKVGGSR